MEHLDPQPLPESSDTRGPHVEQPVPPFWLPDEEEEIDVDFDARGRISTSSRLTFRLRPARQRPGFKRN